MKITGRVSNEDFSAVTEEPEVIKGKPVPRIWYLVANGENALIFRRMESDLEQIADITPAEEVTTYHSEKNRGHIANAGQAGMHYTSSPEDREDSHNKKAFLQNVTAWIGKAANENVFDLLVVAASPEALGFLRDSMDNKIRSKVVKEISKDYVNTPIAELEAALMKETPA